MLRSRRLSLLLACPTDKKILFLATLPVVTHDFGRCAERNDADLQINNNKSKKKECSSPLPANPPQHINPPALRARVCHQDRIKSPGDTCLLPNATSWRFGLAARQERRRQTS